MTRPELLAQLAVAIEKIVDARVDARLAELGIAKAPATEYSSDSPPPGMTRRTFATWCRTGLVVGAKRNGRSWTCSVAAWREARARGPAPRVVKASSDPSNVVHLDDLLVAGGMRRTR